MLVANHSKSDRQGMLVANHSKTDIQAVGQQLESKGKFSLECLGRKGERERRDSD